MTLPLIAATSALAGLSAASLFWFGTDLVHKLGQVAAERKRAKKLAAEEAAQNAGKGGKQDDRR